MRPKSLIPLLFSLTSCMTPGPSTALDGWPERVALPVIEVRRPAPPEKPPHTPLERSLLALGLEELPPGPGLRVTLIYATAQNFTGHPIYSGLNGCFLRTQAAKKLRTAAAALVNRRPDLHLRVVDCTRPLSVQRLLWAAHPHPAHVANPETGTSAHNHGCAVDLTLGSEAGPLEMGTDIDEFSAGARLTVSAEERLCRDGTLTAAACANRRLLRAVMLDAGWVPYDGEWWHFSGCDRTRHDAIP
jgi:D-alanyl-D-alanine dipeptidase